MSRFPLHSTRRAIVAGLTISCLMLVCVLPTDVDGDVVWIRGASKPICGQLVSRSEEQIQIREFTGGKFGEVKTISPQQVETLVVNIDNERLTNLSPEDPVAYRNYAEELSAQRADPAAINLSRRLYLLAAANSTDAAKRELRNGAILGLIALAPNETQQRKLKLFYQLNDPDSGKFKLDPPLTREAQTEPERKLMRKLVISIRQEDSDTAKNLLAVPTNRASIEKWRDLCTIQELDRMAAADQPSRSQLSKLLSVELALQPSAPVSSTPERKKLSWGDLAMEPASGYGVLPTVENVTEFDPQKSVYRNGAWISP